MSTSGRMNVGRRVAALRAAHGDSLRQAAGKTGVSHTTIARIEHGQATASFHSTLRKLAEGYGVTLEYLMTGRDPRQDFELSVRRLTPEQRSRLYFTSSLNRIRMVLQFLIAEYPQEFPGAKLASALAVEPSDLERLLELGDASDLPESTTRSLGESLARLTGISRDWFRSGYISGDLLERISPETFATYLQMMKKAARAGVKPDVLEMAIDLLIMKQGDTPTAT